MSLGQNLHVGGEKADICSCGGGHSSQGGLFFWWNGGDVKKMNRGPLSYGSQVQLISNKGVLWSRQGVG